jgi:hypothetical protein
MANIVTAFTTRSTVTDAVADLHRQLSKIEPKLVLFFASTAYDPVSLAREMQLVFGSVPVFGCTTAGEIVSGQMLKNSIVAMAFNAAVVRDVQVEVLPNIRRDRQAVSRAFANFEAYYGISMIKISPAKYVGLVLIDGLSGAEERTMEKIGDMTNVHFIGASAGDDMKFDTTYVFAQGQAYRHAALLALLQPATEFDFIKTQSFCTLSQKLIPTKVDRERRAVVEFNHRPAAQAYAEAVGVPVDQLPNEFMTHPVGLMQGEEPYVRSPQQLKGDEVVFYCGVDEQMELSVLEAQDIVEGTRQALADKIAQLGPLQGLINFHCILRTLELERKGQMEAYGRLFSDIPMIGFSTYGEEFIGHVNQTSTILVFK